MKESNLTKGYFMDRFRQMNRYEQFGYDGLSALYDYLEQYEDETGEEVELDVIALCCEYSLFDSIEELQKSYPNIESVEDLQDHTQVIEIPDSEAFIIQDF